MTDKPLVGSGCVEGSNAICNIRALSCGAAAIHIPRPQFRRTDWELPSEPCEASRS